MKTTARWVAFLAVLVALAPTAWAGEGEKPRQVEVVVLGPAPAGEILSAAISPLLPAAASVSWNHDGDGVAPETFRPPTASDYRRIWIDARPKDAIHIVAFTRETSTPHVRIVAAPELTPVVAEDVAQITRETVTALLAEADSVMPTSAPPATPPATAPVVVAPVPSLPTPVVLETPQERPATRRARVLLVSASFLLKNDYGYRYRNAYGGEASVAWSFKAMDGLWSGRPFSSLSAGYFQHDQFGIYGGEIAQLVGLTWQPWSLLHLSIGAGVGIERARSIYYSANNALFGRCALGGSVLLPAGFEEMATVTLDAGQIPNLGVPNASWFRPGLLIGIGWRPPS